MNKIGGLLAFLGVASAILSFTDYEMRLLMWIDNWGTGVGWGIRIALIVGGLALWKMAPAADDGDE